MTRPLALGDLIGRPLNAVRSRLGPATVEKRLAEERWLVYDLPDARLRIRLGRDRRPGADSERVASWTMTFRRDGPRPGEVTKLLGLRVEDGFEPLPSDRGLLRCPITDPVSGDLHSLTARVRGGRLVELTAFDEAPDWLDPRLIEES